MTIKAPWCTLSHALAAAPAGSTIDVRAGSYPALNLATYKPSTLVTVTAYGSEHPVVSGISIGEGSAPSDNFAIDGLKVIGPGVALTNVSNASFGNNEVALTPVPPKPCTASSCQVTTPNGFTLTPPMSGVSISGNNVHDGSVGVAFLLGQPPASPGKPTTTTFQNISITGNTFSNMGGIVVAVQNFEGVTIANNTFANDKVRADVNPYCHCDAVHAVEGGDDLMLDANYVYGGRGFLLQPDDNSTGANCSPACRTLTNVTAENNVLVGTDLGLRVLSSPGIRVLSNTIWGTETGTDLGLTFMGPKPTTTGAVVVDNILRYFESYKGVGFATEEYNDVISRAVGSSYSTPTGPHDIAVQPVFVSPLAPQWNFRTTSSSPTNGKGYPGYAPSVDQAGAARRSPPDLGAY